MAKICVSFSDESRKSVARLCRRLGEVEASSGFLTLRVKNLPARRVIPFLTAQPSILSAQKMR